MKIVVTGAGGMVGQAVVRYCGNRGEDVIPLDHSGLDITNQSAIESAFYRECPQVVINCAAWTDVDGCERNSDRAHLANTVGPRLLAEACRRHNALLITISTDYVFDGEKQGFYTQRDQPNPKSVYGMAKLEGERAAQIAWARTLVVRTGYLFGKGGTNFLATLFQRLKRGERLRVIEDMTGTPTYADHLAKRLHELALLDLPGTYHVANAGDGASFAEFAEAAVEYAGLDASSLIRVKCRQLELPAPRPRNSRLRCLLSPAIGLADLPNWREAVAEFARGAGFSQPSTCI